MPGGIEARAAAAAPTDAVGPPPPRLGHLLTVIVLLVGLAASGGLGFAAYVVHARNERRLLDQRVQAAAESLTKSEPSLQTALESAASLIKATSADPAMFRFGFTSATGPGKPFASASVWDASGPQPREVDVLGARPRLTAQPPATIAAFMARTAKVRLAVLPLTGSSTPVIGYAVSSSGPGARYVVYAETLLPANRWNEPQPNFAFKNLDYTAYLGHGEHTQDVLAASTRHLPPRGLHAAATVPYGDTVIELVVTPNQDLGGYLLEVLPWLILSIGLVITIGFAWLTERLERRRHDAETLAGENARLYRDQRTVAETLQQSFLPEDLPTVAGLDFAARYEPGDHGVEIGGDWYDAWSIDDDRVMVVVGDVSGRGLAAAKVTAVLRFAIRAYAAQGDGPVAIVTKLNRLLSIERDDHFATLVCADIDLRQREVTLVNAGHPSPLLLDATGSQFMRSVTGPPIGVEPLAGYTPVTVAISSSATMIAFTDGLFERRREDITVGLERLRQATEHPELAPDDLLRHTLGQMAQNGPTDDVAILAVRWQLASTGPEGGESAGLGDRTGTTG